MAKRKTKKNKNYLPNARRSVRNATLDSLRGLAIALMIFDHIAWQFFQVNIAFDTVRFWTRLSMPLFCVLMGYFLASRHAPSNAASGGGESEKQMQPPPRLNWSRFAQIAMAAAVLNVFYYTQYGQLEVLASLLVSYCAFALFSTLGIQQCFGFAVLAAFAFDFDPSRIAVREGKELFDFPVSVVLAIVATGVVHRNYGPILGMSSALVLLLAGMIVNPPTVYVLWFTPLAVLLVILGERFSEVHVPVLEWIGRYPLAIYVAQYMLLFLLAG